MHNATPALKDLIGQLTHAQHAQLSGSGDTWQCLSPFGELTWHTLVSQLHEPVLVRNIYFCRTLACRIIDAQGEVDQSQLRESIQGLSRYRYCLDPSSPYESRARGHALALLQRLATDDALCKDLLAIRLPMENPHAQTLVRDTLDVPGKSPLTDVHARQACLCVLLSYFRQNVGSCFATAPGILVQTYHPRQLLQDLQALLNTGKLERYFDGAGLEVPLSRGAGVGDYRKPVPLHRSQRETLRRFSHSPALAAALQAAGLLMHLPTEQRIEKLLAWLVPAAQGDYRPLSIEQLLKWIAMGACDIDDHDLQRHALSPAPIIQDGMLVHIKFVQDDKHDACVAFWRAFGQMENAFKRFGENALLKAWEYTLASLTDHTSGFTRSNLYNSLGIDPRQPHGIGHILQVNIQALLDEHSRAIGVHARNHELLAMNASSYQRRLNTSSGSGWAYLKMEYEQVVREMREIEWAVQRAQHAANYLAGLFQRLLSQYLDWFSEFFQEIYDPDLHQDNKDNYADAPAGFRLYFKPTGSQSSQWQAIHTEQDFTQALQEFFRVTEVSLLGAEDGDVHDVLRDLVTRIVRHILDPEFMQQAQRRLAISKGGSSQLGRDCTPWAYVSGGSVVTLLDAYLKKSSDTQTWTQQVEDPHQLFEFTVSCLRQVRADEARRGRKTSRLNDIVMCSPTHAFTLKPHYTPFLACWQAASPQSWLDTHMLMPARRFYQAIVLDAAMQQHLLATLGEKMMGHAVSMPAHSWSGNASPAQFRQKVLSAYPPGRLQDYLAHAVDALLHCTLPLVPANQVIRHGIKLLEQAQAQGTRLKPVLADLLSRLPAQAYWGADALQTLVLCALLVDRQCLFTEEDWQQRIADAARQLRLSAPQPVAFADSNWFGWEFAFVYNPGNAELDIWQCDYLGRQAQPLSMEKWGEWQIMVNDFSGA